MTAYLPLPAFLLAYLPAYLSPRFSDLIFLAICTPFYLAFCLSTILQHKPQERAMLLLRNMDWWQGGSYETIAIPIPALVC
jgi:hypothetical protein